MQLDIDIDMSGLSALFKDIYGRQIPFAMALTLTRTAQDCQKEVQRKLPTQFTIRNTWTEKGIRITPASKTNLQSSIYTKDDYMVLQNDGGVKKPRSGKVLAIPEAIRTSNTDILKRSMRPKSLLGKKKSGIFYAVMPSGMKGIWQREGKKGKPKLLYAFKTDAKVKPRFNFEPTILKTASESMDRQFNLAMQQIAWA